MMGPFTKVGYTGAGQVWEWELVGLRFMERNTQVEETASKQIRLYFA